MPARERIERVALDLQGLDKGLAIRRRILAAYERAESHFQALLLLKENLLRNPDRDNLKRYVTMLDIIGN